MNTAEFIQKWQKALAAYGTPADFTDSTTYRFSIVECYGEIHPFVISKAINYERRRQLMSQQKPYIPKQDDYPSEIWDILPCFLCENVAQAFDAIRGVEKDVEETDNLIEEIGDYFILPNRYPSQVGHSLLVPKNHDDATNRTNGLHIEEGKIRGNIVTSENLDLVIESCERNRMGAVRNHVLDGMSIPNHDHYHLMFDWMPGLALVEYVIERPEETEYDENIFFAENTPFDTLVIKGDIPKITAPILKRMELSNEVYTLVYFRGNLLISPRHKEAVGETRIDVQGYGLAGLPIHSIGAEDYTAFLKQAVRFMPLRGEYDWSRFMG